MSKQTQNSFVWSGIEQVGVSGLQFIVTIILARILSPEDYGLVAMLSIFFAFSQSFIDSGLTGALIQKKDYKQEDCNAVFYFNLIVSVLFYILLYFSAPLISQLFHNDLLIVLTRVYSINLVINAVVGVQRVLMMKRLMFKELAVISGFSSLVSGAIAIIMAYFGYSYWSLVVQILISSILSGILIFRKIHWLPTVSFSKDSFRLLFSYGVPVMFTSIINAIYNNIYSLVIGHKYKAEDLGYYNRAFSFGSFVPTNVGNFVGRALFPVQSLIQDDYLQLKSSFLNTIHTVAFFVIPINIFVLVNAEDIILLLITEKWLVMKPFLQLLTVACIWYPIINMQNTTIKVFGKTKILFWSELLKKVLGIIIIGITVNFDILIMVWGMFFYSFLELIIGSLFFQKVSKISVIEQFKVFYYIPIIAIILSLLSFVISSYISNMIVRLAVSVIIYGSLYILWGWIKKDQALIAVKGLIKR